MGQQASFVDRPSQWFLRIATDSQSHGSKCDRTVHVVWGADIANVNFLAVLGQQFAVVGELFGVFESLGFSLAVQRVSVNVADGDDIAERGGIT